MQPPLYDLIIACAYCCGKIFNVIDDHYEKCENMSEILSTDAELGLYDRPEGDEWVPSLTHYLVVAGSTSRS